MVRIVRVREFSERERESSLHAIFYSISINFDAAYFHIFASFSRVSFSLWAYFVFAGMYFSFLCQHFHSLNRTFYAYNDRPTDFGTFRFVWTRLNRMCAQSFHSSERMCVCFGCSISFSFFTFFHYRFFPHISHARHGLRTLHFYIEYFFLENQNKNEH